MKSCPFCELEARKIFATCKCAVAIKDAFPLTPGHAPVIPRRHVSSVYDLTDDGQAELPAVHIVSSRSGPNALRRLRMHTRRIPRSFAISSCDGSACFLVLHDLLEVCPLIAEKLPLPIRSITERPLLFPASSPPQACRRLLRGASPDSRGGQRGFHVLIQRQE